MRHKYDMLSLICGNQKKKKRIKMNLFDRLTGFENLWSPKDRLGGRDGLRVWNGNTLKLGSDDGCSTINIIKFTELKIFIRGGIKMAEE